MVSDAPVVLSDGHLTLEPVRGGAGLTWQVHQIGSAEILGEVALLPVDGDSRFRLDVHPEVPASTTSMQTLADAVRLTCGWAFTSLRTPAIFWLGPTDPTVRTIVFQAGFRVHPLPQRAAIKGPAGPLDAWYADLAPQDVVSKPRDQLTSREHHVLTHMARGRSNSQIAIQLGISENTVKNHVRSILDRLQAPSRTAAVVAALQSGLVSLEEPPVHNR